MYNSYSANEGSYGTPEQAGRRILKIHSEKELSKSERAWWTGHVVQSFSKLFPQTTQIIRILSRTSLISQEMLTRCERICAEFPTAEDCRASGVGPSSLFAACSLRDPELRTELISRILPRSMTVDQVRAEVRLLNHQPYITGRAGSGVVTLDQIHTRLKDNPEERLSDIDRAALEMQQTLLQLILAEPSDEDT